MKLFTKILRDAINKSLIISIRLRIKVIQVVNTLVIQNQIIFFILKGKFK